MKIISGRFISKSELRNKILKDVLLVFLFLSAAGFVYFQMRSPVPVKFLFKSLFQDVKNSVVEEYSKIYYPTYYFSMQMTPIFDIINQAKRHLRKFNGIPKEHFHLFIKECQFRFNNPKVDKQLEIIYNLAKKELF